jgi:hypothetical protein
MHSIERLKQALRFDEITGRFFWIESRYASGIGKMAGSFDAHGYGQIKFDGTVYKEHRLAWAFIYNRWPDAQIDHINHHRRDNRPNNLREVNNMENHMNRPIQSNNNTGVVGVSFDRNAYVAYINIAGKRSHLGRFKTLEEAASARQKAMRENGFHENHGADIARPKHKVLQKMLKELGISTPPGQVTEADLSSIKETYQRRIKEAKHG